MNFHVTFHYLYKFLTYLEWNKIQDWSGKSNIQQENDYFNQQSGLKGEINEMLYSEHSFVWYSNFDNSESTSESPWEFWNEVLEKDGDLLVN